MAERWDSDFVQPRVMLDTDTCSYIVKRSHPLVLKRYVEAVDLDEGDALHHAEIRADLKRRGVMIGANDLFIAAHALALGLTLVTNNTAEFERVRDLKLENWTLPNPRRRR